MLLAAAAVALTFGLSLSMGDAPRVAGAAFPSAPQLAAPEALPPIRATVTELVRTLGAVPQRLVSVLDQVAKSKAPSSSQSLNQGEQ